MRIEHTFNDDWTLNIGTQYLNGNLHGYAVEANGIKADTDGELLTRNYNWRNLDWIGFVAQRFEMQSAPN